MASLLFCSAAVWASRLAIISDKEIWYFLPPIPPPLLVGLGVLVLVLRVLVRADVCRGCVGGQRLLARGPEAEAGAGRVVRVEVGAHDSIRILDTAAVDD